MQTIKVKTIGLNNSIIVQYSKNFWSKQKAFQNLKAKYNTNDYYHKFPWRSNHTILFYEWEAPKECITEIVFTERENSAKEILNNLEDYFLIEQYQCDPDYCGHSDSIILRQKYRNNKIYNNKKFIAVCYSLESLKKYVEEFKNKYIKYSMTDIYCHFLC